MTAAIPSGEPRQFVAGDTLQFDKAAPDYSASDGWIMRYRLVKGDATINLDVPSADGEIFHVLVDAETTAEWDAGTYSFQCCVENDGVRKTIQLGRIEVLPNVENAPAGGFDNRTTAQKNLEAIEACLAGRSADVQHYKIGNRELTKQTVDELLKLQIFWARRVRRERIARGEDVPTRTIGIAFGPSSLYPGGKPQ